MVKGAYEPLLVAEDSDEDFAALQRLMETMDVRNPIYRCVDGDDVLNFLYREGEYEESVSAPTPSVILLDLNLPGTDGREILEQLKQDGHFQTIPIVVFTTSSNPRDIEFCYRKGANGYLVKPMGLGELKQTVQAFVDYWLKSNVLPLQR